MFKFYVYKNKLMFHIQIFSFKHYWNCIEKNYQHLIKLSFKIYEKILFQLMIPDKCSWHQLTCLSRRYCGCHMWRWQFFNQRFMMLLTREKLVVLIKLKMRKITMVMGKFKKKFSQTMPKRFYRKMIIENLWEEKSFLMHRCQCPS